MQPVYMTKQHLTSMRIPTLFYLSTICHPGKYLASAIVAAISLYLPMQLFGQSDTTVIATDSIPGFSEQLLNEVVVTAKRPSVRVTPDKTIYDLKSTVMGQSGTLLDALSSIPGVNVRSDGAVSLYGNSGATISIDGEKTYLKGRELANYLRSLPASTVSTIGLRTTANAKDDASDKAGVIEVSTRRVREQGFTLGLNGGASTWRNLRGHGNVNMTYNAGRSEFNLLYSFFAARQRIRMDIERYTLKEGDRMLQLSTRRRTSNAHTVKGGWRYRPGKNTVIGTSLTLSRNGQNEFGRMDMKIPALHEEDRSDNHNRKRWRNVMADIYFDHTFSSGTRLTAGYNLFRFNTTEHQLLEPTSADTLRSNVGGHIRWNIGQIDLTLPIGKMWRLEAGAKTTFIDIRNSGTYFELTNGLPIPADNLSSRFRYKANTNAAYTQISFTRGHLTATVGARLEHEKLRGHFSGNETAADTSYHVNTLDIVPVAEIKYLSGSGVAMMLSYSRRIDRPNYADLNPFVYIFDEYTHSGGNINLHASTSDNVQLGLSYGGWLQAALFLTRSDDVIMKGYHEISDRCIYAGAENLPYFLRTGIRCVVANLPVGRRIRSTFTATGVYNRYDWKDKDARQSTRRLTPMLSMDNQFDFGKGWTAELKASYTGKMAYGQVTLLPFGNIDAAVRKNFHDGKAALTLFVRDILATNTTRTQIPLGGRKSYYEETEYRRIAGFSFNYKFHSGRKTANYKERKGPEELERL